MSHPAIPFGARRDMSSSDPRLLEMWVGMHLLQPWSHNFTKAGQFLRMYPGVQPLSQVSLKEVSGPTLRQDRNMPNSLLRPRCLQTQGPPQSSLPRLGRQNSAKRSEFHLMGHLICGDSGAQLATEASP